MPGGVLRSEDSLLGNAATQFLADTFYRCGNVLTARATGSAWMYEFEQPLPGLPVTGHSHEVLYVFGKGEPLPMLNSRAFGPSEMALSELVQKYWTNFAKQGDPNGAGLPPWPQYRASDDDYLNISAQKTDARRKLRADICPRYVEHWAKPTAYRADGTR